MYNLVHTKMKLCPSVLHYVPWPMECERSRNGMLVYPADLVHTKHVYGYVIIQAYVVHYFHSPTTSLRWTYFVPTTQKSSAPLLGICVSTQMNNFWSFFVYALLLEKETWHQLTRYADHPTILELLWPYADTPNADEILPAHVGIWLGWYRTYVWKCLKNGQYCVFS